MIATEDIEDGEMSCIEEEGLKPQTFTELAVRIQLTFTDYPFLFHILAGEVNMYIDGNHWLGGTSTASYA